MSVWGRRAMGLLAALLWAAAITIALAGLISGPPGTETVLLCTLDIGAALALTVCAWLERIITPLITSHILGLSAGMRTGLRLGKTGTHHKKGDGRVIPMYGRGRGRN